MPVTGSGQPIRMHYMAVDRIPWTTRCGIVWHRRVDGPGTGMARDEDFWNSATGDWGRVDCPRCVEAEARLIEDSARGYIVD